MHTGSCARDNFSFTFGALLDDKHLRAARASGGTERNREREIKCGFATVRAHVPFSMSNEFGSNSFWSLFLSRFKCHRRTTARCPPAAVCIECAAILNLPSARGPHCAPTVCGLGNTPLLSSARVAVHLGWNPAAYMEDPIPTIDFSLSVNLDASYSLEREDVDGDDSPCYTKHHQPLTHHLLGLLRVLADLENTSCDGNDLVALAAVRECRAALDKLVAKMDSLELICSGNALLSILLVIPPPAPHRDPCGHQCRPRVHAPLPHAAALRAGPHSATSRISLRRCTAPTPGCSPCSPPSHCSSSSRRTSRMHPRCAPCTSWAGLRKHVRALEALQTLAVCPVVKYAAFSLWPEDEGAFRLPDNTPVAWCTWLVALALVGECVSVGLGEPLAALFTHAGTTLRCISVEVRGVLSPQAADCVSRGTVQRQGAECAHRADEWAAGGRAVVHGGGGLALVPRKLTVRQWVN
ncbi:hypothetical protein C8R45DRAFT_921109 [Mycena sanguinolenta]|nr:hypothetical protein C8R45DRAFT_921109 [Mycena sanguinolenta]